MATSTGSTQFNISTKRQCWCGTVLSRSNPDNVCRIHKKKASPRHTTIRKDPVPNIAVPAVKVARVPRARPAPTTSNSEAQRYFMAMQIVNAAAHFYSVDPRDVMGKERTHPIGVARQVSAYLICEDVAGASLSWTGYDFLGQHHTTIMYSRQIVEKRMIGNETLKKAVETIRDTSSSMPGDSFLEFPFENSHPQTH